ncbi:GM17543 [Drosophila sechellia]|uniref:GM17543 n=1 Tax=Drosophila sechellia TaxID=7238 RepID=B4IPE7_DROSE|nr:GM17543 [Drosophila sechellia]
MSPLHSEEKPKSPEKKDEKVLAKPDDSSKSHFETDKPSPKEYSDDETDDEIDIPKPQDKPISHPTSLVTGVTGGGVKSPLHSEEKPKSPEKKDEKVLAKPDDSSKSVVETDKPSPKEYSDDETDDEIDIPKPQDKPISHPISLVTGVTGGGVKSPLHPEEKSKSPEKKDEKVLAKPDDSSKSVLETDKPSPKEYSDDETDDEIDIPKPQDKPISHPTSLVTGVTGGGVISPLHSEEKQKSPEKKDEKVLAKPDDSSKSLFETDKPSPKEYSADETDDEIDIPKPQDKPISHPTSLVTGVTGGGVKSPLHPEEKPKSPEKKDEKVLAKPDDSSKSVVETDKPSPKEYSDDETYDEIDIPKPQDKPISHPTSLVTGVPGGGVKSPLHSEEKPKSPEKKDEKVLAKPDDSSKSVVETDKPSPKEYSDDETDDEIDIPKPQDKPIRQPTSLVTAVTTIADVSARHAIAYKA